MKTINFIKNIKEKNITPDTHKAFARYSVGEFPKETFIVKVQSKKVVVQTGFEHLNFFHRFLAENNNKELQIDGTIESVRDPSKTLESLGLKYESKRRFGKSGDKFILSKQPISAAGYKQLIDEQFTEFLLINTTLEDSKLKVKKQTTPKLGKPTDKFVKIELSHDLFKVFRKEYLFDVKAEKFKEVLIDHTYVVEDLDVDEDLLMKDSNKARLEAIRKGHIIRKVTIDGEVVSEDKFEFEV